MLFASHVRYMYMYILSVLRLLWLVPTLISRWQLCFVMSRAVYISIYGSGDVISTAGNHQCDPQATPTID